MTTIWILIANASEASIYTSPKAKLFNGNTSLSLITHFTHPQSREKDSDLVADKLGHSGHGTLVDASDPKQLEAEIFAKELLEELEKGRIKNLFDDLMIVAPPKFSGLLNQYINGQLDQMLSLNIQKDYTKDKEQTLIAHLKEHL